MATSSKVQFKLETLREKALESIDARISRAELEVDSYDDEDAFNQRVAEWRARQEAKISEVFSRLGGKDISDRELSEFQVDPIPELDRYERRRAEARLRDLQNLRTQIVAKSESLVGDEDGNIALTKTQLSEFFGL